jgi:hypothetical protein
MTMQHSKIYFVYMISFKKGGIKNNQGKKRITAKRFG